MIGRYARAELTEVWSDGARFALWLDVECAHLEARERRGQAPSGAAERIRAAVGGRLSPERILEIERTSQHDVIAFLTHLEELAGPDVRFLHVGLTSSDVLDTALALQLVRATDLILEGTELLLAALLARAREHKHTPMIGRSHGIHAEVTTFGLALLGHYAELERARASLVAARADIAVGKLSGPVGTFAATSPDVEGEALGRLGLSPDPVSTQVVARDRHARYFSVLAVLASVVERLAINIRHGQRSEVGEVQEPFGKGQKGSSAMPHKKNPVLSENVTGLARLVRSYAGAALENVALWHERDISHSSVERVIGPDATALTDFMVRRMARVIEGLVVHPDRMAEHLASTRGLVFSGHVLLALVEAGMERQAAYAVVQRNALPAWESGGPDLHARLLLDPEVRERLSADAVAQCFHLQHALRHVDSLFERAVSPASGSTLGSDLQTPVRPDSKSGG